MADMIDRLVKARFLNLYGAPNAIDPKAFVGEYRRALGSVAEHLLKAAIDRAIDNHVYPTWPTVGECKQALHSVCEEHAAEAARTRKPEPPGPPTLPYSQWSPERKAEHEALLAQFHANMAKVAQRCGGRRAPPHDVSRIGWEARYGKAPPQSRAEPQPEPGYRGGEIRYG